MEASMEASMGFHAVLQTSRKHNLSVMIVCVGCCGRFHESCPEAFCGNRRKSETCQETPNSSWEHPRVTSWRAPRNALEPCMKASMRYMHAAAKPRPTLSPCHMISSTWLYYPSVLIAFISLGSIYIPQRRSGCMLLTGPAERSPTQAPECLAHRRKMSSREQRSAP